MRLRPKLSDNTDILHGCWPGDPTTQHSGSIDMTVLPMQLLLYMPVSQIKPGNVAQSFQMVHPAGREEETPPSDTP